MSQKIDLQINDVHGDGYVSIWSSPNNLAIQCNNHAKKEKTTLSISPINAYLLGLTLISYAVSCGVPHFKLK